MQMACPSLFADLAENDPYDSAQTANKLAPPRTKPNRVRTIGHVGFPTMYSLTNSNTNPTG